MKLGKDSTQGDVRLWRATRVSDNPDTDRIRGTEQGQIAIRQFMRIARLGYGVHGCSLIFISHGTGDLWKGAGLRRFAWTTEPSGSGGVVCGEIEYVSKDIRPQHGVRCKVSTPSSAGVDSYRLHVDVGTEGEKTSHCIYLPLGPRGSASTQGNTCS